MKVNNKDIKKTFNADVVSFSPSTMQINNNLVTMDSSYSVNLGVQQLKPQTRKLILDFYNEDDMSDFTAEISSSFVLDIDDGYTYWCHTKDSPDISEDMYESYTYSVSVYTIKQKDIVIETVSNTINIQGNIYTEAVIELTSKNELASYTINGITVNKLKADDTFVIDGIDKKVFYSSNPDISVFDDTDLVSFPKFYPGENGIAVSDANVEVVIKYYPTYM